MFSSVAPMSSSTSDAAGSTTSDATSISCCTSSTSIARTSSMTALAFVLRILTHHTWEGPTFSYLHDFCDTVHELETPEERMT